jgi:copper(I)-binding protein
MFTRVDAAAAVLILASITAIPAFAEPILTIEDAYARTASDSAKSGAGFMVIRNSGDTEDRLIAARADVAQRVELHTHMQNADGLMMMVEVEDGFPIPAGGAAMLRRGGNHVMLMGLNGPLKQGDTFPLTLVFETSGERTLDIIVDRERMPQHGQIGHGMGHNMGKVSN